MNKEILESAVDFSISILFMGLGTLSDNPIHQFGYFILALVLLLFLRLKYIIKSEILHKNDLCYKTLKDLVDSVKDSYTQEQKGF